ncbi:MAG: hypothetical protein RR554_05895 [Vagococcus sp.]|uniref:hypothetical protein n=1 Tax=Vagococcus sp. TaxID=1933889 RepID=UPI002FC7E604
MKSFIFVMFLSGCLFIGSSCSRQKAFDDYDDQERGLNLQDAFEYDYKKKEIFTSNKLDAKVKFSGIDTLWELDCQKNDELVIAYKTENKTGKFKVLLVKPDQEMELIVENTETGTSTLEIPKGKNYIRIVGSQSEADIEMSYKVGTQTKIIMNKIEENKKYGQGRNALFN